MAKNKKERQQELIEDLTNLPDLRERLSAARKIVDHIDNQAEIAQLREIAADIQERAAELGLVRPDNRLELSLPVVASMPAATPVLVSAKLKEMSGLSKRERQIRAIVAAAVEHGFDVLSIPVGGKGEIKRKCMTLHPELFGVGPDPFKEAWQKALDQKRVRTTNHDRYIDR